MRVTALALGAALLAGSASAEELKVDELIAPTSVSNAQQEATIKAASAYATFWSTGDESLLTASVAPSFIDHTLPAGRPQGPQAPALASKNLHAAVPDVSVEVKKMIVTNEYVAVMLEFKGHFTGTFRNKQGNGEAIDFIAFNVLKVYQGSRNRQLAPRGQPHLALPDGSRRSQTLGKDRHTQLPSARAASPGGQPRASRRSRRPTDAPPSNWALPAPCRRLLIALVERHHFFRDAPRSCSISPSSR
jgi:predicted ester cyclase